MRLAELTLSAEAGISVACITGEVDLSNASELRLALLEGVPHDAIGMVLDLVGVDYLDSTGIHLIYRLTEELHARGQRLEVVVPPASAIEDALRLAGVSDHLATVPTREQALTKLRDRRPAA
jgi:anti-anti-sigma factor